MSSVQSPTAAVTQVCTCSLGCPYSSPLRRSRTVPETRVTVQVWQMPMRQPYGIPTPASSPASRIVVAPSTSTSLPELRKVSVPPSPPSPPSSRENRSTCSWSSRPAAVVVLGDRVEHRRRAAGPGLALAPVGADRVEVGEVEHAVGVGVQLVQPQPGVLLLEARAARRGRSSAPASARSSAGRRRAAVTERRAGRGCAASTSPA